MEATPKFSLKINDLDYSYSISKLEKVEGIKIKLFESKPKTNIYYEYEATTSELTNNIKFLLLCEDLDEMVSTLKEAFDKGHVKFLEETGKYYIELQFEAMGKSKIHKIEFIKYEPKDPLTELSDKIITIQNDIKNISKEIEEIKKNKNNDIDFKEKIKEYLQDKDIKMKLYEEFEQIMCSKFNLTKENDNLINIKNSIKELNQKEIMEKADKTDFNEKLKNIEEQLKDKTNDLNNIKSNLQNFENKNITESNFNSQINNKIQTNELIKNISENINLIKNLNNYIEIKIKGNGKIKFLQQWKTYKYFFNFERDDIELIIDGENASLYSFERIENFTKKENSNNCYLAQELAYNLNTGFNYYLNFNSNKIHTIKIIFKKKLYDCSHLFYDCKEIVEIDMSNFDCSQVTSCESMFDSCISLIKLNLGELDFNLCKNFRGMFCNCGILEKIDVSHFCTKNSTTFEKMFCGCEKLKKADVSKFNSSKCKSINSMFRDCQNLTEINMLNWDMNKIELIDQWISVFTKTNGIDCLFYGCKKLNNIKMSSNFSGINNLEGDESRNIFEGLPQSGTFSWKKGVNCDNLLKFLPVSWNKLME